MVNSRNWLRLVAAAALLAALPGVSIVWGGELKVGDQAPGFKLPGSDGKTYDLADFKDKMAVVVAWYPKAFTGG